MSSYNFLLFLILFDCVMFIITFIFVLENTLGNTPHGDILVLIALFCMQCLFLFNWNTHIVKIFVDSGEMNMSFIRHIYENNNEYHKYLTYICVSGFVIVVYSSMILVKISQQNYVVDDSIHVFVIVSLIRNIINILAAHACSKTKVSNDNNNIETLQNI
jgi:hypothetical protein